jgi:hypothetical protein
MLDMIGREFEIVSGVPESETTATLSAVPSVATTVQVTSSSNEKCVEESVCDAPTTLPVVLPLGTTVQL